MDPAKALALQQAVEFSKRAPLMSTKDVVEIAQLMYDFLNSSGDARKPGRKPAEVKEPSPS